MSTPPRLGGVDKDRTTVNRYIRLIAGLSLLGLANQASAAPVAASPSARNHALILIPLTLTKLEDLSFGTIIPSAVSGTVTVPANGSAPITAGGITLVASDPTHPAQFGGAGTPGRLVVIDLQNPGTLSDGFGNTVAVLAVTLDGSVLRTIDAAHSLFFKVGGVLQVNANQPEGLYEADVDVTVSYL